MITTLLARSVGEIAVMAGLVPRRSRTTGLVAELWISEVLRRTRNRVWHIRVVSHLLALALVPLIIRSLAQTVGLLMSPACVSHPQAIQGRVLDERVSRNSRGPTRLCSRRIVPSVGRAAGLGRNCSGPVQQRAVHQITGGHVHVDGLRAVRRAWLQFRTQARVRSCGCSAGTPMTRSMLWQSGVALHGLAGRDGGSQVRACLCVSECRRGPALVLLTVSVQHLLERCAIL